MFSGQFDPLAGSGVNTRSQMFFYILAVNILNHLICIKCTNVLICTIEKCIVSNIALYYLVYSHPYLLHEITVLKSVARIVLINIFLRFTEKRKSEVWPKIIFNNRLNVD